MRYINRLRWILPVFVIALIVVVLNVSKKSESRVEVTGGDDKEIVVTIGGPDRSVLEDGDALRKSFKFREAIEYYQNVLDDEDADIEIKKEAKYNIGLCLIWLGEYDEAGEVFNEMLSAYSDDGNATGYAQYCLAWIEVQEGKYHEAVARLQNKLAEKNCTDIELCARTQFKIGKIYLAFIDDYEKAQEAFQKVLQDYPDTKIAGHPYVKADK